ncbi:MAG TPA: enolase C-terminal domain-like protein [Phycisphaerae bacterium]|nr:enolase C-terminal domain-like protein [Phycisphaerae bacterium]
MANPLPIANLTVWRMAIPMRRKFKHATAERAVADPIVLAVELADHTVGYGETHPRPYVTGESHEGVLATIRDVFVPILLETRPANFGEALEAAAALPTVDDTGRSITAARAAVELAVLDAYGQAFNRSLETLAGWLDDPQLGPPGSRNTVRFSGVVSGVEPRRAAWSIRKMRLFGLRDFKLKVGDEQDDERLDVAVRTLGGSLIQGRTSLRIDANGAWSLDQATERLRRWQTLPIACVEQPLAKTDPQSWAALARRTTLPLMADESLVTPQDAEDLIVDHRASWFNIRISKNGGLIPSMQLAATARRHNMQYQLGCMVGETSILSAAGRWFLQLVPNVRFAEGSFGSFLLRDDVIPKGIRFGFGGRWQPMTGPGLGLTIQPETLDRLAGQPPERIVF